MPWSRKMIRFRRRDIGTCCIPPEIGISFFTGRPLSSVKRMPQYLITTGSDSEVFTVPFHGTLNMSLLEHRQFATLYVITLHHYMHKFDYYINFNMNHNHQVGN